MRKSPPPFTEEHKRNLSLALTGHKVSGDTCLKISNALFGRKLSEEHKLATSLGSRGKNFSETHKHNISIALKGKKKPPFSEEHRDNLSKAHLGKILPKGALSRHWKGGLTELDKLIRNSLKYDVWRNQVFVRDNFTCQKCGKVGGNLEGHHINHFKDIIRNNNIKSLDDATLCNELWDINNGITLCIECHDDGMHKKRGEQIDRVG